jgi:hypothetical protein
MKMRLKPLRGQFYKSSRGEIQFIEKINGLHGLCKVFQGLDIFQIPIGDIVLPIIDTKDYEKIEDVKYKGD